MVGTIAVGCAKSVIKLTGNIMKAIDYEEENTKRVTALELTGGPAHGGLTVLDWFAGKAMAEYIGTGFIPAEVAEEAYDQAEAMMAERKKRYTPQGTIKGVTGKHYG